MLALNAISRAIMFLYSLKFIAAVYFFLIHIYKYPTAMRRKPCGNWKVPGFECYNGIKCDMIFDMLCNIMYHGALMGIKMETRDLFELIPINGICSGVLIISPEILSINILRSMFIIDNYFQVLRYLTFINIDSIESFLHNFEK